MFCSIGKNPQSRRGRRTASVAASERAVDQRSAKRDGQSLDRVNNNVNHAGPINHSLFHRVVSADPKNKNEGVVISNYPIKNLYSRRDFTDKYLFGRLLGRGTFSEVHRVKCRVTSAKFALKEVDKHQMQGRLSYFVENEIQILHTVKHPNICNLIEAYQCDISYLMLFELGENGDLFEMLTKVGLIGEPGVAHIIYQLTNALAYLHNKNIVHRDLKPENVLLSFDYTIKLTDFGLACLVEGPLYRICGTPTYVAPEVLLQKGYGVQIDMWSAGVILYTLLCGYAPFRSRDREVLYRLIKRGSVAFDLPEWRKVSYEAREVVKSMLTMNPGERLRAEQVIETPWIQSFIN
ncbi:hypothetical protein QR680_011724 [Steinernema hermaphroditum]|uniref:Protein kinase domain-containing protein n=1 Tax=Steinernema hermaphroditum TaxID=289476 RepID=A0AA39I255_9BILA|nr:hypothetical protein QR680_011724 [Steinernema hermaphroditum]